MRAAQALAGAETASVARWAQTLSGLAEASTPCYPAGSCTQGVLGLGDDTATT